MDRHAMGMAFVRKGEDLGGLSPRMFSIGK